MRCWCIHAHFRACVQTHSQNYTYCCKICAYRPMIHTRVFYVCDISAQQITRMHKATGSWCVTMDATGACILNIKQTKTVYAWIHIHTYLQACRPYVHIVSHTGGGMLILRSCINKVIISCVASCIVLHASKKTSLLCLHAQKSHVWFIYRYYENYANGNRKVLSTLTLDGSFVPA